VNDHQIQSFHFEAINIQLIVPVQTHIKDLYEKGKISFPYWSQVWPSSIALAEFISIHPEMVKEKQVLELGAGLGLPSMIAAHYAKSVICSDHETEAVKLIERSATLNGLENLKAINLDWNDLPADLNTDVLLLSDINYEQAAFQKLATVLEIFLGKGTLVILSTPQRLMAKDFITPLLKDCIKQEEISVVHNKVKTSITILLLKR
jgi:methyltransferase-like protein 23